MIQSFGATCIVRFSNLYIQWWCGFLSFWSAYVSSINPSGFGVAIFVSFCWTWPIPMNPPSCSSCCKSYQVSGQPILCLSIGPMRSSSSLSIFMLFWPISLYSLDEVSFLATTLASSLGIDVVENIFFWLSNAISMTSPCYFPSPFFWCRLSRWNLISIRYDIHSIKYRGSYFLNFPISWWLQSIHSTFSFIIVSYTYRLIGYRHNTSLMPLIVNVMPMNPSWLFW